MAQASSLSEVVTEIHALHRLEACATMLSEVSHPFDPARNALGPHGSENHTILLEETSAARAEVFHLLTKVTTERKKSSRARKSMVGLLDH